MPFTDQELVAKVRSQAGRVNHNILTDQEVLHAKVILANTEHRISELNQQTDLVTELHMHQIQAQLFKIALSPHKQIPPEILCHVFSFCLPTCPLLDFPPRILEAPWLLGQVCSLWRNLSRREVQLWGRAVIHATETNFSTIISRVDNLLPPGILTDVTVELSMRSAGLFFDSPHLREWLPRVYSLDLRLRNSNAISYRNVHNIFASPKVDALSKRTKNLRHLSIHAARFEDALQAVGQIIPWGQLTSFRVQGLSNFNPQIVFPVLQACTALENLALSTIWSWTPSRTPQKSPNLPSLLSFSGDCQLPPESPHWSTLWERITHLDLGAPHMSIAGDTLYGILQQCANLETLVCSVTRKEPLEVDVGGLRLEHLRSMTITDLSSTWLFQSLRLPSLSSLVVDFSIHPELIDLNQLLAESCCPLSSLVVQHSNHVPSTSPRGLRDLLITAGDVLNIDIGCIDVGSDILNEIGAGDLLPRAEEFRFATSADETFLDMMEMRAQRELRSEGRVILSFVRPIVCSEDMTLSYQDDLEAQWGKLRGTYGINGGLEFADTFFPPL